MRQPREIEIQESILRGLEKLEIYPFSVFFTDALELNDSILSITFYIQEDLDELLKILNYKNQCDKSGYNVFKDTNTICLSGIALTNDIFSTL